MNILVAGGAGFIGTRVADALVKDGHDVTVLDMLWFGKHHKDPQVKVVQADIFDIDSTFLEGFDQVIFLAGVSNDPMAEYSPQINYIYNSACPAYLAYIAKQAGVKRFIYASSCSVYGNQGDILSTEEEKAISLYPYGISKLQGERAIMGMGDENFSTISLRQGTVCGHSPRMRFDLVINTMFMKAKTEGAITVDHPEIWRPILALTDAVNAYRKAVEAPPQVRGVFNVSSFNVTVGELGEAVKKHFKKKTDRDVTVTVKGIKNFRNYRVSTEKAEKELGLKFKETPQTILDELDAEIAHDLDFDQDHFYNIRTFKKMVDARKLLLN